MALEDRGDIEARQPTVVQCPQPFLGKIVVVPVGRTTVGARGHGSAVEAGEVGHRLVLHRAAAAIDDDDSRFSVIHAKVSQFTPTFRAHQKTAAREARLGRLPTAPVSTKLPPPQAEQAS